MKVYPFMRQGKQMNVAGFMSGSGTNLVNLIEYSKQKEKETGKAPYDVAVIFTDDIRSNAFEIGKKYDKPVVARDKRGFYSARRIPLSNLDERIDFDRETVKALAPYEISVAAYAGYMSIATQPLISSFLGVNVHPADLTILNEDGKRKYTGDEAVLNAILAREKYIRSTTHVVEHEVDGGKILMVSAPVEVVLPKNFDYKNKESLKKIADGHQSRLKEAGDWKIFPRTLELISQGRFARDNWNQGLYFDGKPVQNGIRFEDLR